MIDTIDDAKLILDDGTEISYVCLAEILKELADTNLLRTPRGAGRRRPVELISAALQAGAEAVLQGYGD